MSNVSSGPMPLDRPAHNGSERAFQPLSWLRRRLFSAPPKRQVRELGPSLDGFPPPVGRGQALRLAHRALKGLFEQQEGLRQVLPHLGLLERALASKGSRALRQVPVDVLQNALEQLQDLQSVENHPDLPTLRTRLVESLALRSVSSQFGSGPGNGPETVADRGAALLRSTGARQIRPPHHHGVEVQETSHSAFSEAEQLWSAR